MKPFRRQGAPEFLPRLRYRVASGSWHSWRKAGGAIYEKEFIEEEIRDRICPEIRFGVVGMWSDPLEQLGLVANKKRACASKRMGVKIYVA